MKEILAQINWVEVLAFIWSAIILPILAYVGKAIKQWLDSKKLGKYGDMLKVSTEVAVKEVYQTLVNELKGTDAWTKEKQDEVKAIAKQKAVQGISNGVYDTLTALNGDLNDYLDNLIEASIYELKNGK